MTTEFNIDELQDLEQACIQMLSFWSGEYKEQKPYFDLAEKIRKKVKWEQALARSDKINVE